MIKTKRAAIAGLAIALGLGLAACGGDDDSAATTVAEASDDSMADDSMADEEMTDESMAEGDDTDHSTADGEMTDESMAEGDDTEGTMAEGGEAETSEAPACEPIGETTNDPIPAAEMQMGLTFDLLGRGDQSFNDSAAAGADRAIADLGIPKPSEVTPTGEDARASDLQLQADNSNLVIGVGFSFAAPAAEVAAQNPDVKFAIVDDAMMNFDCGQPIAANAAGLVFAEEQGSYLVGVAAGLKTETNTVGFIGGVSGIGLIEKFEAGFVAGAKSVNPDIEVKVAYISEFPDFAGFEDPARAKEIANGFYSEGADIIYSAAGLSGTGTFQAAKETTEAGDSKVWGIGVDSDQYNTVDAELQEYVLTSMLKRVDVAVYEITQAVIDGNFTAGETRYDLSIDGVGYSTSGGFVDDIVPQLEEAKAQIIDGTVEVPTAP